jgi:hypothetical protein
VLSKHQQELRDAQSVAWRDVLAGLRSAWIDPAPALLAACATGDYEMVQLLLHGTHSDKPVKSAGDRVGRPVGLWEIRRALWGHDEYLQDHSLPFPAEWTTYARVRFHGAGGASCPCCGVLYVPPRACPCDCALVQQEESELPCTPQIAQEDLQLVAPSPELTAVTVDLTPAPEPTLAPMLAPTPEPADLSAWEWLPLCSTQPTQVVTGSTADGTGVADDGDSPLVEIPIPANATPRTKRRIQKANQKKRARKRDRGAEAHALQKQKVKACMDKLRGK